jgi:hypothetical protein
VPLATALCKTFLMRMLNDSWAGRNPTRVAVPIEEEKIIQRLIDSRKYKITEACVIYVYTFHVREVKNVLYLYH